MAILTITLNPSLDKSTSTNQVSPEKKIRCESPRYEPGGGGINVSRAIKKMGGESTCLYLGGGYSAERIGKLLEEEGVDFKQITTAEDTRENLMVMDQSINEQYRFGMPGSKVSESEWQQVLDFVQKCNADYVVASGSLPPGVPADIYRQIGQIARKNGARYIVDTSGEPLKSAANEDLFMLKPNVHELASLLGKERIDVRDQEKYAKEAIRKGTCEMLLVSLGAKGAMLATKEGIDYIMSPVVDTVSAVGAGDSMVGGTVLALSRGLSMAEAARYGVAAGTAATMTPGSELCRGKDVEDLYRWLQSDGS